MVYLSIDSVYAADGCGIVISANRIDVFVSMPLAGLYSTSSTEDDMRYAGITSAYSYNRNDFSGPLPTRALSCRPYCYGPHGDLSRFYVNSQSAWYD
jgi:hypothetical protein